MPRKPIVARPPHRQFRAADPEPPGRWIHQCMQCGAPVNAVFASGEGGWCPACSTAGHVVSEQGRLPDPQLYGLWRAKQRDSTSKNEAAAIESNSPLPTSFSKGTPMKTPKAHSGIYSCLDCYVEFDLIGETSLKCDTCDGPLRKGALDEFLEAEDEDDEKEDRR